MKGLCIFVCLIVAIKTAYSVEVGSFLAGIQASKMPEGHKMVRRAAGGEVAPVGEHPYLVGLIIRLRRKKKKTICGSVLLNAERLVTAAHCLDRALAAKAIFGTQHILHGGLRIKTKDFVKHPLHRPKKFVGDYDIAIVKLPQPVEFTDTIKPISLPSSPSDAEVVGEWAVAAGWGLTTDHPWYVSKNPVVNQVRLQIIPEPVCKKRLWGKSKVDGNNVCTSGEGGVGVCRGDGGGPLVVERDGRKVLIGIGSYAHVLCEIEYPSAFTRVYSYLDFIQQHL